MISAIEYLQQRYNEEVPITGYLGLQVKTYDGDSIDVHAPLEPSRNTHGTDFGGSLYSIAALTGWGLLHLRLKDDGIPSNAVIKGGEVEYHHPVKGTIVSKAEIDAQAYAQFVEDYKTKGRGDLRQIVVVETDRGTAMTLTGHYVAISK